MNTSQIQCFLTIADTLNFARAAEQLHITQPAVTQQIHALEKELGVRLFHRSTHSVRLTDEGLLFLPDARQIAAVSDRARKRFVHRSSETFEVLTLGGMHMQAMSLLTEPLAAMQKEHPAFHPQFQMVPFRHIYRLLEEGSLDLVAEFQSQAAASFLYKELTRSPMVCICAGDHPLAGRAAVTPTDLRGVPLVVSDPSKVPPDVHRQQETLLGERLPAELYFCDTVEAIGVLVAAGYGVSVLPALLVPTLPGIRQIPLEGGQPVSFGLYYKSWKDRPLLKAFITCAQRTLNPKKP